MKTVTFFKRNLCFSLLLVAASATQPVFSQTGLELVFKNSFLLSGSAGQDGAKYVFPGIKTGIDAVLTIKSRSNSNVKLDQVDETGTGYDNAFQPRIGYNGNVPVNSNWWMEFDITFYNAGNYTASNKVQISNFKVTGLDIDGDNSALREYSEMHEITSFVTSPTTLLTSNLLATMPPNAYSNLLEYNYRFVAPTVGFPGIDTTAINVMVTSLYMFKKNITLRIGGQTGNNEVSSPSRQNSVWFKEFSLSTLPVKLASFTATLNNNKADLKWTTASELNVSHFAIEKSLDGRNFSDAGLVFAFGNTAAKMDYNFSDNLSGTTAPVIYYRLRSVDIDGNLEYSEIRIIRVSKAKTNDISILTYPNPVAGELRITVPANWQNKPVVYEIFTISGQLMKRTQTGNCGQTETVNTSNLAPGFYIVKVNCEGASAVQKIVKQ